jgi:hypothetical protein
MYNQLVTKKYHSRAVVTDKCISTNFSQNNHYGQIVHTEQQVQSYGDRRPLQLEEPMQLADDTKLPLQSEQSLQSPGDMKVKLYLVTRVLSL